MLLLPILLLVGAAALGAWAQRAVLGRFQRYAAIPNRAGLSGAEVAQAILAASELQDIRVERTEGRLSDHYDPRQRVLRLSPEVHDGRTVSSLGIAAHEAGHALQEAMNYAPLGMRNLAVPTAQLGSLIGLPVLLLGAFLHSPAIALLGFVLYAGVVLFQLVTVPVELDASRRALTSLQEMHLLDPGEEEQGVQEVLSAASMTYVAAALSGLAVLLYYGLQVFGRRR
jgi:Zn-dependent membrane protease YugP